MTTSVWARSDQPPKRGEHRVASVWFLHSLPADRAPLDCTCGWSGTVGGWEAHRGPGAKPGVSRASTELEQFERVN